MTENNIIIKFLFRLNPGRTTPERERQLSKLKCSSTIRYHFTHFKWLEKKINMSLSVVVLWWAHTNKSMYGKHCWPIGIMGPVSVTWWIVRLTGNLWPTGFSIKCQPLRSSSARCSSCYHEWPTTCFFMSGKICIDVGHRINGKRNYMYCLGNTLSTVVSSAMRKSLKTSSNPANFLACGYVR